MKKTKVVCTMGPNTNDRELMRKLIQNGMDVARFNFSHGDYAEHEERINKVKEVSKKMGKTVSLMLDTKGPEMRLGDFAEGKVYLKKGNKFTLTNDDIPGDETHVSINHKKLYTEVKPGNTLLLSDGLVGLHVDEIVGKDIVCTILNDGPMSTRKRAAAPGVSLGLPAISEQDRNDIIFGIEHDMDFVAASFIQRAEDVEAIRALIKEHGGHMEIISKIECVEAVKNIDAIIAASDAIMVARGDLGVEMPAEEVPLIQKDIIKKCNKLGKPVIVATQMLETMTSNPRPTRAEASDVANAIYDGTDVVMLSGETANGKYPLEALKMMVKIAERTEQDIKGRSTDIAKVHSKRSVSSAVCNATVQTADNLNAKAIVCPTISGFTARLTSKLKPNAEIIGCSPYDNVLRKMQIYWGVRPLKTATETSTDKIIEHALVVSEQAGYVEEGDTVIVSAGIATTSDPSAKRGLTNTMRVVTL